VDRRTFVVASLVGGGLISAPLAAEAQPVGKVWHVGMLETSASDPARFGWWTAFRLQLRELGYLEGQNVIFDARFADERVERLSPLAVELVNLKVDIIVTGGAAAAQAAERATTSIPIVMATGSDQIALGLVGGLARPEGNVTGVTSLTGELSGKRLGLLKEIVSNLSRVAILWPEDNEASAFVVRNTEAAAGSLGMILKSYGVRRPGDFESRFSEIAHDRVEGLLIIASPKYFAERKRLADLAVRYRLPSVVGGREYAEAGGLLSYGPSYRELFRRAAIYVDKILKGAKPADLPVEQPTKFELVINLKTAKALGLTIPPSLLQRADQVIE
jgi:putative ABC transport system substrate-binding protein